MVTSSLDKDQTQPQCFQDKTNYNFWLHWVRKKIILLKKRFCLLLDTNLKATGELYWDDGESLVPNDDFSQHNYYHFLYNFTVNQQSASLTITRDRAAVLFK